MPMAEGGKEAERRRLAEALRANLGRRKAAAKPRRAPQDTPTQTPKPEPGHGGERG